MEELRIYRSRKKLLINAFLCVVLGTIFFFPSYRTEITKVLRLIFFFVLLIYCIWQLLQVVNKDLKMVINHTGIVHTDGEPIKWDGIGKIKLTEVSGFASLSIYSWEKHYFVEIYERNSEYERGDRLIKKIDVTDFDVEVEDISLALKRIAKEKNIIVEFNVT